jgi:hypothetical protein
VFTEENLGRKDAGKILVDVREGCVQIVVDSGEEHDAQLSSKTAQFPGSRSL